MPSPSYTVADVIAFLREFAPAELAESWDNVGLLVGDESWPAKKVLTCLTLTEEVAEEAASTGVGLVVSHHPLLFKAVKRITAETSEGRTLLTLLKAGIAVYSPHTAFDSAAQGINRRLAAKLGLADIRPIRPFADESLAGGGRFGHLTSAVSLSEFLEHVRSALMIEAVGYVVGDERRVEDGVLLGQVERGLRAPGERLGGVDHLGLAAGEEHA